MMPTSKVALFTARCPHCRSIEMRTVGTRNGLEQAFHWLLHPYRCCLCGRHFFLFRWQNAYDEAEV